MQYHEFDPHPDLRRFVLTYWTFAAPPDYEGVYRHRVLPDGCVQVSYGTREDAVHLVGPRLEAFETQVKGGDRYWGVRFRPGAAGALLHRSCLALRDYLGPAHVHLPTLADALMAALQPCATVVEATEALDAVLRPRVAQAEDLDSVVEAGVAALVASEGQARIADVAADLGLSERQFQRRFRRAVGLTPKQFARIRRFRASVGNILRADPHAWGRIAAEHGYADQAHLTREFQDLYGAAPTTFAEIVRAIEHRDVQP